MPENPVTAAGAGVALALRAAYIPPAMSALPSMDNQIHKLTPLRVTIERNTVALQNYLLKSTCISIYCNYNCTLLQMYFKWISIAEETKHFQEPK